MKISFSVMLGMALVGMAKAQVAPVWQTNLISPYPTNVQYVAISYGVEAAATGETYQLGAFSKVDDRTFYLAKYSATGSEVWRKYMDYPASVPDGMEYTGIALASNGNIYVSGTYQYSSGNAFFVRAYNQANGNLVWGYMDDTLTTGKNTYGQGIRVDASNNIYVGGTWYKGNSGKGMSLMLNKLSPSGTLLWSKVDSLETDHDLLDDEYLAMDMNASRIVLGTIRRRDDPSMNSLPYIATYDSDGNKQYSVDYDGIVGGEDYLTSVNLTATNELVIAGRTKGDVNLTYPKAFVAKYNATGSFLWDYRDTAEKTSTIYDVAFLPNGDMICGGHYDDGLLLQSSHYARTAYRLSSNGQLVWRNVYPSGQQNTGSQSAFTRILVSPSGGVYLGGSISEFYSYLTLTKINPATGSQVFDWRKQVSLPVGGPQMDMDASGAIYYAGSFVTGTGQHFNIYFAKFLENSMSVDKSETLSNVSVFPNPSSGLLNLRLGHSEFTGLKLLDMTGKTVYTASVSSSDFQLDLGAVLKAQGVYFLVLENSTESLVTKVIYR